MYKAACEEDWRNNTRNYQSRDDMCFLYRYLDRVVMVKLNEMFIDE
jgi:hypothetical protein